MEAVVGEAALEAAVEEALEAAVKAEAQTVDAIVRPQLTITQSPPRQLPKEQCCLLATGKVSEKFRGWVSGPPLLTQFQCYPPPGNPPPSPKVMHLLHR